ncbi:MAG: SDR family NAD(P)-dependent oxidoreductase [Pseudomonadales bacterium]
MQSFAGRVAVITGAGSGMGRALAVRLAAEGCHLSLADVNLEGLAESVRQAEAEAARFGHEIRCHQSRLDVIDADAFAAFAGAVIAQHGRVDLLFNNAGVALTGPFERVSPEDFRWLMDINFWGVVNGCRVFLPYLKQSPAAHIVNTSSVFGLISVPTQTAYHAAKFAVKGFTDSLRLELAETSVRVSCVMPGGVKTGIVRSSRVALGDNQGPTREEMAARFERYAALTPLDAADEILQGVRRGAPRILVGRDAKFLALLVRLFPVRYFDVLTRFSRGPKVLQN